MTDSHDEMVGTVFGLIAAVLVFGFLLAGVVMVLNNPPVPFQPGRSCEYSPGGKYPEADTDCAFTAVSSGVRSLTDGGTHLNQSHTYSVGIPTGTYLYRKTSTGLDRDKPFSVFATAVTWGNGTKSQIAVYRSSTSEQLDVEFGSCGGIIFPCDDWPAHWIRFTAVHGAAPYVADDLVVNVTAGYHAVRMDILPANYPEVSVTFYIDGTQRFTGRANVPQVYSITVMSLTYPPDDSGFTSFEEWGFSFPSAVVNGSYGLIDLIPFIMVATAVLVAVGALVHRRGEP